MVKLKDQKQKGFEAKEDAASPARKKSPYKGILCGIENVDNVSMEEDSSYSNSDFNSVKDFMAASDSEDEGEDDARCPRVRFSAAEKASFWKPWRFSMICKVLGKRVGFNFLASKLYKFWQRNGTMKLIDLSNDFYLARFLNRGDYLAALQGGPWMVADHLLSVANDIPILIHMM